MKPPFPIEACLPHAGQMLLLDGVDDYEDEALVARYVVPERGLFHRDDGRLPAWVGLEIMAQATAAHAGVTHRLRGTPVPVGFLVGARGFVSSVDSFAPGVSLQIRVRLVTADDRGLGMWDCRIEGEGVLATSRLSVFEPPDVEGFMQRGAR